MRAAAISLVSLALTTVVLVNAYYQKKQFYPSVVYITKSNPSMAVIYIQAFIFVLLAGKLMRKVFFGQLRTAEFEHLMERAWYAITETCLAFTVFRDDFNPKFVALFTLLLFLKSFHWLAEDRVDYMERSPVISWLFHLRVLSLLFVLGTFDFYFVQHAYLSTMYKGASVQLVFGFEYAILLTMVANITIKYVLHTIDLNSDAPWENKAVFLLYTELIMGLIKVVLYVTFVVIMVRIYTLPLFALRPMYYTIRNFKKALNDVILSRRAIHNMNTLYPDATPDELQAADNVCIICREEMVSASKKLPCNHIFHTACLRSWFQRQQTCPTCRLNILRTNPPASPTQQRQDQRPRAQQIPNPFVGPNPFINFNPFQQLLNQNLPNANAQVPIPDVNQQPTASGEGNNAQPNQGQQQQSTIPPFPMPPFMPFPFMPFLGTSMPPTSMAALSPEELLRMEGNERENVEARIKCLQNIQVMLDAAVLMMQQYSTAVTVSSGMPQPSSQNPIVENSSTSNCSSETAESKGPLKETSEVGPSTVPIIDSVNSTINPEPSTSNIHISNRNSADEELRRRRLQRFEKTKEENE